MCHQTPGNPTPEDTMYVTMKREQNSTDVSKNGTLQLQRATAKNTNGFLMDLTVMPHGLEGMEPSIKLNQKNKQE